MRTQLLVTIGCLLALLASSSGTGAGASPSAPGRAAVFLSPHGSDSGSCTRRSPCRSFDRGYHVASPGQIVEAAAGSYGTQTLYYDASKAHASRNVVIRPGRHARV